jgi:hypothetical protein
MALSPNKYLIFLVCYTPRREEGNQDGNQAGSGADQAGNGSD